jgi:uncharacterized protein YjiS (DUF1127 family)
LSAANLSTASSKQEHSMLNSSRPVSRATTRLGVRDQELDFDLRDDSRAARQAPAEPARPDWADVGSPQGAAARADRIFTAVISVLIEGFALYAMLYLPPIDPEQSSPAETEGRPEKLTVRERRRSIAVVSSSANPEAKQSGPDDRTNKAGSKSEAPSEHASLPKSYRLEVDRSGRRHWLTKSCSGLASKWRHWRHERDIAALVAHLADLDDRTLRDMGIPQRSQIEQAVRYGRDL